MRSDPLPNSPSVSSSSSPAIVAITQVTSVNLQVSLAIALSLSLCVLLPAGSAVAQLNPLELTPGTAQPLLQSASQSLLPAAMRSTRQDAGQVQAPLPPPSPGRSRPATITEMPPAATSTPTSTTVATLSLSASPPLTNPISVLPPASRRSRSVSASAPSRPDGAIIPAVATSATPPSVTPIAVLPPTGSRSSASSSHRSLSRSPSRSQRSSTVARSSRSLSAVSAAIAAPLEIPVPAPESNSTSIAVAARSPIAASAATQDLLPVPSGEVPIGNVGDLPRAYVAGATSAASPHFSASSGASTGWRYRVMVNARDEQAQSLVQAIVPDAFLTSIGGESLMQVGVFRDRDNAEQAVQTLNQNGLVGIIKEVE